MIIELLSREHLNIEKLLAVLERELEIFDRGGRRTTRSFARSLAISKFTPRSTIIRKKTWSLPS